MPRRPNSVTPGRMEFLTGTASIVAQRGEGRGRYLSGRGAERPVAQCLVRRSCGSQTRTTMAAQSARSQSYSEMLSQTIAPILDDNTQTELTVWRQLGARGIQHAAHLVVHVHKRHVWALAISAAPFDQLPNTF